ncbi:dTDP-4-dehydrorhamnose reductase subunit, NAD(P)-binding, of dTDP-L-rhamnose synthase [Burkholderiales bacterium]|nr:dTDP-4-dehydrorhamnose reductase subunit, NAD(P)-binding, of dTDP-L-rhamnose synthase [Burkholderiales bacterium]
MHILLFGANGQVGWELQRSLSVLGTLTALGHADADLEQPLQGLIERAHPDVIVNAAAYTAVDQAESEPARAMRINAEAVGEMARAAKSVDALLVHYSTDYVFDGEKSTPYQEDDPTGPLNWYGRSKLAGEQAIRAVAGCRHLILRTSWVYAKRGKNFARTILERAQTMDRLQVVADAFGAPTSAELLADVTALALYRARIAQAGACGQALGTFHLVPSGVASWHEYACYLIEAARARGVPVRVAPEHILPVPAATFRAPARRPMNSRLDNRRLRQALGIDLPDWRVHARRFVDEFGR